MTPQSTPPAALETLEIDGLTADSRRVAEGFLFAALPGSRADGRAYIGEALARGASAVLAPEGTTLEAAGRPVALLTAENPRRALAEMAAAFYKHQPREIAAITGTNGKTSVAVYTQQIWQALGLEAASLGTLGLLPARDYAPAALTTPDPVELQACLARLAADGVDHLAMEASSHGLDQYRLHGVRVTAAAFTNLSHDHLDYHHDMESYLAAKARLFTEILQPGGTAVLNADIPEFESLRGQAAARGLTVWSYGRAGKELRLVGAEPKHDGLDCRFDLFGQPHDFSLSMAGRFQAMNVLAALGLAVACGAELQKTIASLPSLSGVPGRMERIGETPAGGQVIVDYAHTPNALETVLEAARAHTPGKLWVIVGCGGDRDRAKRPLMGGIAQRLADRAIVTDDNPRSENPAAIRAEMLAAAPNAEEIGDRGEAIRRGVAALGPGDSLVIAGKGHETGQTVGGTVFPFDDRDVARAAIQSLEGGRR
ncbi:MAG: UDP-N-acetylmuramoyl-L-alanyl-D-glutamate--2,6-diaminopimelate ligase [Rhodovibrionaceae bacterium]